MKLTSARGYLQLCWMFGCNLTLFENNSTMQNTDVDQIRTEQPSKLYVRYNKPEALDEQRSPEVQNQRKRYSLKFFPYQKEISVPFNVMM